MTQVLTAQEKELSELEAEARALMAGEIAPSTHRPRSWGWGS